LAKLLVIIGTAEARILYFYVGRLQPMHQVWNLDDKILANGRCL